MQTNIAELRASAAPQRLPFGFLTPHLIQTLFPATPPTHIAANLPHILAALTAADLADTPMLLMALATIRAEAESFLPLTEGISRFNTSPGGHPFDLYDHRSDLGNQGPPDGASFRGRGFVQLTGRANYIRYGREISLDLVGQPELACEPATAARILACFLKNNEAGIRHALATNDLAHARRLVNGGSNGLNRFKAAYQAGTTILANYQPSTNNYPLASIHPAQLGSPTQSPAHVDASTAPTQPQSSHEPAPQSPSNG
jgi:peptidoglycan L-alanyl-D-glutamate endopeptidase CwlK